MIAMIAGSHRAALSQPLQTGQNSRRSRRAPDRRPELFPTQRQERHKLGKTQPLAN